jgi:hypothetical protein
VALAASVTSASVSVPFSAKAAAKGATLPCISGERPSNTVPLRSTGLGGLLPWAASAASRAALASGVSASGFGSLAGGLLLRGLGGAGLLLGGLLQGRVGSPSGWG